MMTAADLVLTNALTCACRLMMDEDKDLHDALIETFNRHTLPPRDQRILADALRQWSTIGISGALANALALEEIPARMPSRLPWTVRRRMHKERKRQAKIKATATRIIEEAEIKRRLIEFEVEAQQTDKERDQLPASAHPTGAVIFFLGAALLLVFVVVMALKG